MTTVVARRWVARAGPAPSIVAGLGLVAALVLIRPGQALYFTGGAGAVSVLTVLLVAPLWVDAGGVASRAFAWKPLVWLGVISYGIYLWHWPFIVWFDAREASGWSRVWRVRRARHRADARGRRALLPLHRTPHQVGDRVRTIPREEARLGAPRHPRIGPGGAPAGGRRLRSPPHPFRRSTRTHRSSCSPGTRSPSRFRSPSRKQPCHRGGGSCRLRTGGCSVTGERPTDTWGNLVPADLLVPTWWSRSKTR